MIDLAKSTETEHQKSGASAPLFFRSRPRYHTRYREPGSAVFLPDQENVHSAHTNESIPPSPFGRWRNADPRDIIVLWSMRSVLYLQPAAGQRREASVRLNPNQTYSQTPSAALSPADAAPLRLPPCLSPGTILPRNTSKINETPHSCGVSFIFIPVSVNFIVNIAYSRGYLNGFNVFLSAFRSTRQVYCKNGINHIKSLIFLALSPVLRSNFTDSGYSYSRKIYVRCKAEEGSDAAASLTDDNAADGVKMSGIT